MSGQPTELRATDTLNARLNEAECLLGLIREALVGRESAQEPLFSNDNLEAAVTVIHRIVLEAQENALALDEYRRARSS
jgi:hypothetical protein